MQAADDTTGAPRGPVEIKVNVTPGVNGTTIGSFESRSPSEFPGASHKLDNRCAGGVSRRPESRIDANRRLHYHP